MTAAAKAQRGLITTWIIIGTGLILVMAVSVLAMVNYNREKKVMQQVLREKGAALIRSFEAGARTGMMGMFGGTSRLQTLLTETAAQDDILYIALVDRSGTVLAHNEPKTIGRSFADHQAIQSLAAGEQTGWRIIEQKGKAVSFEVYKVFQPIQAKPGLPQQHEMMRGYGQRRGQHGWMEGLPEERILDPEQRPLIFIGMDPAPYVDAMAEDFSQTLLTSALILLLGLTGVVSLFWAQSYRRSRKLLQDTRAFAAEMVANLPEGIIATGPDRAITFINPIASALLGLAERQVVGQNVAAVLPADLLALVAESPRQGMMKSRELSLSVSSGRELILAVIVTGIMTEEGDKVGTMIIIHDLTETRRLQNTLQKQEKLAAIGNLAAGVAHEVRNPLSSIKGYATYFSSLFEEGSERKKAAVLMTAEVDRLNRVISELLEITRPSDINPRPTDISFLLDSSLRLVRQEAEAGGVRISTDIAGGIPPFLLDPDRLTQALLNLYINAIQAMPDGGQLTISAGVTPAGLELVVGDSGGGIPAESLGKIFDPYFTSKKTGTGLGLAVVQKVIEAHGGTIRVQSETGRGTRFILTLPGPVPAEERL
ncbi:MAG TPA: PAS domain-containing sensor histidine kinase [Desulfobulbaceae bacterium]|nr:PAS domain-containing sensor histidine kinase [Desulfobulbaceae bacterium]